MLRNCVFSITTFLFRSETKRLKWRAKLSLLLHGMVRTSQYSLKNMHFCCTFSIKTKIKYYQWFVLDFLKIAKINSQRQKKNQSVLIANSSSRKIQKNLQSAKINFRKNFVSHGMHYQKKYLLNTSVSAKGMEKTSIEKRLENCNNINQKQNCALLPFSVILLSSLKFFNHHYIFFFCIIKFSREHVCKSSLTLRNYAGADPLRFRSIVFILINIFLILITITFHVEI